ncbi:MAG: efflux RND transporter periplasmic adaptor subunit [Methylocella sp.]
MTRSESQSEIAAEAKSPTAPGKAFGKSRQKRLPILLFFAALAAAAYFFGPAAYQAIMPKPKTVAVAARPDAAEALPADSVRLSEKQLAAIKVAPVAYAEFQIEKSATGSIDFNQDMAVQVFAPYQGRIKDLSAKIGDRVKAGQTLYTIDSTDLLQAESTLIQTAGVLDLANRSLARNEKLVKAGGGAQKDLDQSVSDQQTAEGNLRAARDAVRYFGKTDAEIDRIVADRHVDSTLIVPSPISGEITARSAATGLFVQPGNAPAPYTVADTSTVWMNSFVVESEIPALSLGQQVEAQVLAYPDRVFEGKVTTLGASVDPVTRRLLVRSEIKDPENLLRPGMFATFVIRTGKSSRSIALPPGGVVREGDGTMSAWVTDGKVFTKRTVRLGLQQNGYDQVLEGLKPGEQAVTDGAVFLSNMLAGGATD